MFTYIVFFLFFNILIWMSVSEVDVMLKSNVIVKPNEKISNINGEKLIEKSYEEVSKKRRNTL